MNGTFRVTGLLTVSLLVDCVLAGMMAMGTSVVSAAEILQIRYIGGLT